MNTHELVEKPICRKVVDCLLGAGLAISVNDGEETTLRDSTDRAAILAAMFTTDEDQLLVTLPGGVNSFVRLIYGNGVDVISDYGLSLEEIVKPANDYAESLDG